MLNFVLKFVFYPKTRLTTDRKLNAARKCVNVVPVCLILANAARKCVNVVPVCLMLANEARKCVYVIDIVDNRLC